MHLSTVLRGDAQMDFKNLRIDYMNEWPHVLPFEVERNYFGKVAALKDEVGSIFFPFKLKSESSEKYNKAISFIIDAMEELEKYPNHSFEFMFKAYDTFSTELYSGNITDRTKWLSDNVWSTVVDSNTQLGNAFQTLYSKIPYKTCQYIYSRLCDKETKAYSRVTKEIGGSVDVLNRKQMVDAIERKYGYDYSNYANTIRLASGLYKKVLLKNDIEVCGVKYNISTADKLHLLSSGYLYTLRNDTMHGSNISITKSSKTTLSTYANNYYAFLVLYYLVITSFLVHFNSSYEADIYDKLANNMIENVDLFSQLFGNYLGR